MSELEDFTKQGKDNHIKIKELKVGADVILGDRVKIVCDQLILHDQVKISNDVTIIGGKVEIGFGSSIEERVMISRIGSELLIGDNVIIAHDCKITVPQLKIGDYCTINNHCMFSGNEPMLLGHNAWIGQNCVLNSQQKLTIGNNFGLGMYSCVYTHGYFGELLEGCQVYKEREVNIGHDVWVLGQFNMISPGVNLEDKVLVLNGSNVNKSVPFNSTVGGSPARDFTDKLKPYETPTMEEKFGMMKEFMLEWVNQNYADTYSISGDFIVIDGIGKILITQAKKESVDKDVKLICVTERQLISHKPEGVPIFDLKTKTYNKTKSALEIDFIRFMKSYRARFVPEDNPVIN